MFIFLHLYPPVFSLNLLDRSYKLQYYLRKVFFLFSLLTLSLPQLGVTVFRYFKGPGVFVLKRLPFRVTQSYHFCLSILHVVVL